MTIITWNSNMAFRKKADRILQYKPDILIVQECEHPDKINFALHQQQPTDYLWFGENKNKGLGIFSYSDFSLRRHKSHNEELKLIVPIVVKGRNSRYTLFAVWANNPQDPEGQYVTQVWKATQHYARLIKKNNTILVGDFNSNTIWDRPKRIGNHSTVVARLAQKNIHSAYHIYFKQQQGLESHPTLYMYRHQDKPYHIDYCFASADLMNNLATVEVGGFDAWKQYSDHVPLVVTFDIEKTTIVNSQGQVSATTPAAKHT